MAYVKNICSRCERHINDEDDFCPDCGTLFKENVKCIKHPEAKAEGVCVICCEPYCTDCGLFVNDRIFLCAEHSDYEIFEDMARVYGSFDSLQVDYAKNCLEQSELNSMIYTRKATAVYVVDPDFSVVNPMIDNPSRSASELKLLVPFQQVIKAEEILRELEILH